MRATLMYGAGDVRVENVPDPAIQRAHRRGGPRAARLHLRQRPVAVRVDAATEQGGRMGHEFLGVVEDVGAEVSGLKRGDLVVAPFVWSDNTCDFCREGLQTSCRHGGRSGLRTAWTAARARRSACRRPRAPWSSCPSREDSALLPSLLTLSDVFRTGHHCAVTAGVGPAHDR